MDTKDPSSWTTLLKHPDPSADVPPEDFYRAACIGAVTLLYESGDSAGLTDVIYHAVTKESRLRALAALENLTKAAEPVRTEAIRSLFVLAVRDGLVQAGDFLKKTGLRDRDAGWNSAVLLLFGQKHQLLKTDPGPEALTRLFLDADRGLRMRLLDLGGKVLPNWTVLMLFLNEPSEENRRMLLDTYKIFSPDEQKLIRFCAADTDPNIRSLPADLLLRYEDEAVSELCQKQDLHPSDTSQEALFYFLSGQWERYYASDSEYRRIRIAYEQNDPELQRRLIAVSRESGNNAWLRHIDSDPGASPRGGSLADQHLLVRSLIEQKQWGRLWELLPNVPLLCMPAICDALEQADSKPSRIEEASFLKELSERIRACEGLSPVPVSGRFCEAEGTALGIAGGGNHIAVLYADRRIMVWDKRTPDAGPVRISSNHLTFRKIILSHDGKYLCADCGNGELTVFSLPGGQAVKTIRCGGGPFAGIFLQPDDRRLILLGQNGKGLVCTFPGGAELYTMDIGRKDYYRTSWDAQTGRLCAIALSGDCTFYDVRERRIITDLKIADSPAAAAEEFSNGKLSFIAGDETLSSVNLLSGKRVLDGLVTGPEKVRRISEPGQSSLYLLGDLNGQIRIFDPTAQNTPALLTFGTKSAVSGLWYDREGSMLYGCAANGIVRSWDLGLFKDMCRILPLLQLPGFNRIDEFCKKYPEPGVRSAAAWLKTVIAWRRRFDIDLDFGD